MSRNVTALADFTAALALTAVCVSGDRVALHLSTRAGQLIVTCPLAHFNEHARAERDHHGRPFVSATRGERPTLARGRPAGLSPLLLPADKIAKLRAAFARYQAEPSLTQTALAAECGVSVPTAHKYFTRFRDEAAAAAGPVRKPNGSML